MRSLAGGGVGEGVIGGEVGGAGAVAGLDGDLARELAGDQEVHGGVEVAGGAGLAEDGREAVGDGVAGAGDEEEAGAGLDVTPEGEGGLKMGEADQREWSSGPRLPSKRRP
ncbi:MAG: hypothetical protein JOZ41_13710 [Chloroflexi bacterium]|nr:hypothetical protein [Chloroflexota bacterium]